MGTMARREGGTDYVQTEHLSAFPLQTGRGVLLSKPQRWGKMSKNDLSKGVSVSSRVLALDRMLETIFNNQQEHQPIRNIPDIHNWEDHPQSCIVWLYRPHTVHYGQ